MTKHLPKNIFVYTILVGMSLMSLSGCETMRKVLGTSIHHLEHARENAISNAFDCDFEACFDTVLALARNEQISNSSNEDLPFDIFQKDRIKGYIVVMGIKGNIDTTEVGIFLTPYKDGIKMDISSLSSSAKEKVAQAVFGELSRHFNRIK